MRSDLDLPELPVVISSSGHGGYEDFGGWIEDMQDIVAVAQENVGCNDSIYGGTVGFVDTKPSWITMAESPDDAGHHFHNNARTFLNIGKTMGDEMILAINDMAYCNGSSGVDCDNPISPGFTSIGNRVWNDLNMDGINDPDEPGIPGVSWSSGATRTEMARPTGRALAAWRSPTKTDTTALTASLRATTWCSCGRSTTGAMENP